MSECLFNIFGDHFTKQNVTRQPLFNNENMGKKMSGGPLKPNEPLCNIENKGKKDSAGPLNSYDPLKKIPTQKKSFLINSGKTILNTPVISVFTPCHVNVGTLIYNDSKTYDEDFDATELEFTKPLHEYDNYHKDLFDYLPSCLDLEFNMDSSPPDTPPPMISQRYSMEFASFYEDEFLADDLCVNMVDETDFNLPKLY